MATFNKLIALIIVLLSLYNSCDAKKVTVDFLYKGNAVLNCAELGDKVSFYSKSNDTEEALAVADRVAINDGVLTLKNLRKPEIEAEYYCKNEEGKRIDFDKKILPFLYKPEKPSLTITHGNNADFECKALYFTKTGMKWTWYKENETLSSNDKIQIVTDENNERSVLTVKDVRESDRGTYECKYNDVNGEYSEKIVLRVKNPLAALWPFLAIIAEVIVLCLVILIYEKKCTKKSDDDNEQNQAFLKEGPSADLKKRTTKA